MAVDEDLYRNAPVKQVERLHNFRATHPYQRLVIEGVEWEYIASGQGEQAVLILGGGISLGESAFNTILRLEKQYRVLSPSYPPMGKMGPIAAGLAAIIEQEGFVQAHVMGHSLGAGVGHVFIRLHPERVDKLVLDGFGLYTPGHVRAARLFFKLPYSWLIGYYRLVIKKYAAEAKDEQQVFFTAYLEEVMTRLHTRESLMGQFKLLMDISDNAEAYGMFRPVERPGKVLLILAEDDRGFSPQERQALKDSYPGAQVHGFSSGGHMAGLSRRDEFDAVVDQFLGE
jgi:maspardin